MRTKTLASLIILCGATAAFAQVTTSPQGETTANNSTLENSSDPTQTTTPNATDAMDTGAPENRTDDAPPQ